MNKIILNNEVKMPQVGIGTFLLSPEEAYQSVLEALKDGYRLIDTANIYGNVVSVGRAIQDSKIRREDIFVSTKIWPSEYEDKDIVDKTLKRMGLEYIDLLFLHQPTKNWRQGYGNLINAYRQGKIKAIGISNFEGEFIRDVLREFDIAPQVIQVECHPYYSQKELRNFIEEYSIHLMSWYPLGGKGNDSILKNEMLQDMADRYHKSVAQIILRWHIQMGFAVIPGSKDKEHIKDNIMIDDFILEDKDMECISSLDHGKRFYIRNEETLNRFGMISPKYED
jgi:diketogulonate reductase-like aldo/keto reductase